MTSPRALQDEAFQGTAFAEASTGAMIGLSSDRRIVFWNEGAEKLFGYEASDVMGRDVESILVKPAPLDDSSEDSSNVRIGKALTTRQRQVLKLIADGRSTRDIASKLGLSVKTIETHRGHLMQRLKLKSIAGLVRYAVSIGLVPTNPFASKQAT